MKIPREKNEILTIDELSRLLKIPKHTLYKLVQEGRIPAIKVGRHWRFQRGHIERLFEAKGFIPPLKILVVDDEVSVLELLSRIFKRMGHGVWQARSGEEAIQLTRTLAFDLVFIDIRMPGMDGVQTLKALKEIEPHAKAVMMTAFDIPDLVEEALCLGAVTCIYKPFDLSEIIELAGKISVVEFFKKEVRSTVKELVGQSG